MKAHLQRFLKYCTALLVLLLLVTNCERESAETPQEAFQEDRVKRISLSELQSRIGNSSDYSKLSALFDVHKTKPNPFQKLDASDDPYLVTDEIVMIENDDTTFYTFKIENNAPEPSFYNLVVAMDETNTAQSAQILEYTPSAYWLNNTTLPFSGEVKLHENDLFSLEDINNSLTASGGGDCISHVSGSWRCNHGYNHSPDDVAENPGAYSCTSWTYTITIHYISGCGGGGGGGGYTVDNENDALGGGGGYGSGGTTGTDEEDGETVNEEECMQDDNGNCIVDETVPMPPKEDPCPEGYIKDKDGNCVEQPCPGDPVPNPEIAPQLGPSGMSGGLHNTCTRTGSGCAGNTSRQAHNGVDIKSPYGAPVYAMYDGVATKATQFKNGKIVGSGHQVSITSIVNGESLRLVYFHLQEDNRASGTVSAGDIIGYQGVSGNLAVAIKKGYTTSHVHIKAELNGQKTDPLNYFATTIDPQTGQISNPCN